MNDLPKYLAQYGKRNIVLLAQTLCNPMYELRADVTTDGAMLTRFTEEAKPEKFGLSPSEADAFAMSWLAWRGQQYDAEQAEIRRLQEVKERAFAIARECPAIVIADVPPHTDIWEVSLGEEIFSTDEGSRSYGPDELLSNVESAKAEYDKQQQIKADVEKALSIASKLGMAVEAANDAYYHVNFHTDRRSWVEKSGLLSTVKEVADKYLQTLLNEHPAIHLVKLDKSLDMPTTWIITRDGHEGECVVQGFSQVLKTVEQYC
jgi:hypothetical protein